MGDVGDDFRAYEAYRKARRDALGVECAECKREFPRGAAKILLPNQRCWRGHRDPRPHSLVVEWDNARAAKGEMHQLHNRKETAS